MKRAMGWTIEWAKLDTKDRQRYVLAERCDHCRALEGQHCMTPRGMPTVLPHAARTGRAMTAFSRELLQKERV